MSDKSSGWFDPVIANKAYIDFATYAPRCHRLQQPDVIKTMTEAYYGHAGCRDQLQLCSALENSSDSNKVCHEADVHCVSTSLLAYKGNLV